MGHALVQAKSGRMDASKGWVQGSGACKGRGGIGLQYTAHSLSKNIALQNVAVQFVYSSPGHMGLQTSTRTQAHTHATDSMHTRTRERKEAPSDRRTHFTAQPTL